MVADTDTTDSTDGRPDVVPARFDAVPGSLSGYAISDGDLFVDATIDPPQAYVRAAPRSRSAIGSASIITEAARSCPREPSALRHVHEGDGFIYVDMTDLNALTTALKHFERHEAGIGDDKWAYEIRTALNHARPGIRRYAEE